MRHNFEIDTEVGGKSRSKKTKNKTMVKWNQDDSTAPIEELELDKNGPVKFDQFQVNESKFGISTDYDESSYTTKLNMHEYTEEEIRKAGRLASEIERDELKDDMKNRHMMEERGIIDLKDNDEDEEALYSAVVRTIKVDR